MEIALHTDRLHMISMARHVWLIDVDVGSYMIRRTRSRRIRICMALLQSRWVVVSNTSYGRGQRKRESRMIGKNNRSVDGPAIKFSKF